MGSLAVSQTRLHQLLPGLVLGHVPLGTPPTPVRRLESLVDGVDLWLKDESRFGDGGWAGNKVRKLEWIIPEARRRGMAAPSALLLLN